MHYLAWRSALAFRAAVTEPTGESKAQRSYIFWLLLLLIYLEVLVKNRYLVSGLTGISWNKRLSGKKVRRKLALFLPSLVFQTNVAGRLRTYSYRSHQPALAQLLYETSSSDVRAC